MWVPGIRLSPHSPLVLQTGVSTPMFYMGAELRSSIFYSKHLAHCAISTVLPESLNASSFTQMKGVRTTGLVHLLFPLTRMFFPSLHSLPSLIYFISSWDQPIRSYLFTRVLSECTLHSDRIQEGDSKVAPTAKQVTGTITHGCPCVYKSNCSRLAKIPNTSYSYEV